MQSMPESRCVYLLYTILVSPLYLVHAFCLLPPHQRVLPFPLFLCKLQTWQQQQLSQAELFPSKKQQQHYVLLH